MVFRCTFLNFYCIINVYNNRERKYIFLSRVSVDLSEHSKKILSNFFGTVNNGKIFTVNNEIITTLYNQILFTKAELKEIFSEKDIIFISEHIPNNPYNGSVPAKQFLLLEIKGFCFVGGIDFESERSTRDESMTLIKLIESLTDFQAYVLLVMSFEYLRLGVVSFSSTLELIEKKKKETKN